MRAPPACLTPFLKGAEGCLLTSAQDQAGVWTIGYGHTGLTIGPGLKIDQANADGYLANDEARFAALAWSEIANAQAVAALSDHEWAALISFAFNLGSLGATIPGLVRAGKLSAIPGVMARYDHAHVDGKLVELPGLKNRRAAEIALWSTGDIAAATAVAQVAPAPPSSATRALDTPPTAEPSAKPLVQSKQIWLGALTATGGAVEAAQGYAGQLKDLAQPLADNAPFIATVAKDSAVVIFLAGAAMLVIRAMDEKAKRT